MQIKMVDLLVTAVKNVTKSQLFTTFVLSIKFEK